MVFDSISDCLTRIRNAGRSRKNRVDVYPTKMNKALAGILQNEGFIKGSKEVNVDGTNWLRVYLKYEDGDPMKPMISGLRRASKPGLRRYCRVDSLPRVMSGYGLAILSTNKGVITDRDARKMRVGGEHLCSVW